MKNIPPEPEYTVVTCEPNALSEAEIATCLAIIEAGDAVDVNVDKLRHAEVLAIARLDKQIVGVGAIKRADADYAAKISERSGFKFSNTLSELGYVAVDVRHGNKGLSKRLAASLLAVGPADLYATTYAEYMKRTLTVSGFETKGKTWPSRQKSGQSLSLWIRTIKPKAGSD